MKKKMLTVLAAACLGAMTGCGGPDTVVVEPPPSQPSTTTIVTPAAQPQPATTVVTPAPAPASPPVQVNVDN